MSKVDDVELEISRRIELAREQEREAIEVEKQPLPLIQKKQKKNNEISNLKGTIYQLRQTIVGKEDKITALRNDIMDIKEQHQRDLKNIDPKHQEELEKEIKKLRKETQLRTEELERKILWQIKNKQENKIGVNLGKRKCIWCQKLFMKSELTPVENLGNFCPECLAKKEKSNGKKKKER